MAHVHQLTQDSECFRDKMISDHIIRKMLYGLLRYLASKSKEKDGAKPMKHVSP